MRKNKKSNHEKVLRILAEARTTKEAREQLNVLFKGEEYERK